MLRRFPIALPQVKAVNTSKNLLSEISRIIYSFVSKERTYQKGIQQYDELNKVVKQNGYYIYEF